MNSTFYEFIKFIGSSIMTVKIGISLGGGGTGGLAHMGMLKALK